MMKLLKIDTNSIACDMISLFNNYPPELIEAALLPLLAKDNDYCINEPMNVTHVFYAELNELMQRSLQFYLQSKFKDGIFHENHYPKSIFEIIQILTVIVPVSYIFCKDPNHKFANLHVVLHKHEYKPFEEIEKAVNFSLIAYPKITCTIHSYGTITDLINKGHFYFSNLCIPTHCIYQNESEYKFIKPDSQILAANNIFTIQLFTKKLNKAVSFFEGAKVFNKKNEDDMVVFMLQQSCEFAYRSLIITFKGKDIKSHDLIILRKQISIYEPQIMGLTKLSLKKEINLLNILNEAYAKARYDSSYHVAPTQLPILFLAIKNIIEGVTKLFNEYTFSVK